ncbi:MAG TPA: glycerol-3-phosphate dehydrogenase/oxidase [Candidatus Dormibacteraeota bacterium]
MADGRRRRQNGVPAARVLGAHADRERTLERLESETFDLLVIGGGVIGARIALEATMNGARVAMVDAGDFGGATSSASSKLIHGGLRYLQMYDFNLVREAHAERRALLDRLAPHLVTPLTFVLPVYKGGPHGAPAIAAGMLAYAAMSGFRHSRAGMLSPKGARKLVPLIKTDGMVAAGVYEDAQTHDSRLVLATVTAAARAGAAVLNYTKITGLDLARGGIVAAHAGDMRIRCRSVINAAGPWVDAIRLMEDPRARPMARLSKGAHIVLEPPRDLPWQAAVTTPLEGGRVSFAVPWEGMLLLGTTDTDYEGDPAAVRAEPEDIDEILSEASRSLPAEVLARDRIRYTFAGLRVLARSGTSTAKTPREEVIRVGPAGMVSVAGGKLTTHRQIALKVLQQLEPFRRARLTSSPLPGAGRLPPRPADVPPDVWKHLTHLYGDEAPLVLHTGRLERIHPEGTDVWGQVIHAVEQEWAITVDDVVRRRTTLEIRGQATPEAREAIGQMMASISKMQVAG